MHFQIEIELHLFTGQIVFTPFFPPMQPYDKRKDIFDKLIKKGGALENEGIKMIN